MQPNEAIGKVVAGRFRIVRFIGEGGMGSVYEAEHATLSRRFALKVLHRDLGRDRRFVERFRREAVAAGRVDHPNIAQTSDFGQLEGGEFYLVMEYLEGVGLDAVIRKEHRIALPRAILILTQVADALEHAHRAKVVHRDLKPENVLLCTIRDQSEFVKILDFGIARIQTQTFSGRLTLQGQIFGTAEYVSPEQATDVEVDGRSDLYSLGVLAFEMTTGTVPFEGTPAEVLHAHVQNAPPAPSTRVPEGELPTAFDEIVLRLLAKKPADRYQTGSEVRRDLLRLRAMLAAAAKGIPSDKRREIQRKMIDSGGWRPIGSKPMRNLTLHNISKEALREISTAVSVAAKKRANQASHVRSQTIPSDHWRNAHELRRQLQGILRKLALAIAEAVIGSGAMRDALREIFLAEEEIGGLSSEIARLEQNFERIRFETGERENALRYALVDLRLERSARAKERGLASVVADLDYQIGELEKRVSESTVEKQVRIHELAEEVGRLRGEREARERAAAERYQALAELVDSARGEVAGEEFVRLYQEFDGLRSALERARHSLPPV